MPVEVVEVAEADADPISLLFPPPFIVDVVTIVVAVVAVSVVFVLDLVFLDIELLLNVTIFAAATFTD